MMRPVIVVVVVAAVVSLPNVVRAQAPGEAAPPARIDSVGLFKNGLAVVRLAAEIPASGRLEIPTLPEPVHGTFWIESDEPVSARMVGTPVDAPLAAVTLPELLQALVGRKVVLQLAEDTLEGVLLGETPEQRKEWDRDYAHVTGQPAWRNWARPDASPGGVPQAQLVFVRTGTGVVAVPPDEVRRVHFDEIPEIRRERPVLRLDGAAAGGVTVSYLTKGLSWAPSYRIDLSDPATLVIAQKAVIRNELSDLGDVDLRLISGFPSVRFAGVDSVLSARQTWTNFFQQVANAGQDRSGGAATVLLTQNRIFENAFAGGGAAEGGALGPADEGEGVDLHYQPIGRHSLAAGESLALDVAEAGATYERVVEWNIPDTRGPNGRPVEDYRRQQDPDAAEESAWDAIVFRNPFRFPLTTAAAMLVQDGEFQGQQLARWTNPGEQTSIRITKALSVATRAVENEVPDTRKNLRIAGNDHYEVEVEGRLTIRNHRGRAAVVLMKRRFSGELLAADGEPERQLLEVGVYSINKRNELRWRLELEPGQEKAIDYRYRVLVDN